MSMKRKSRRSIYTVSGTAIDQETIIRQRPMIEDYVKVDMRKSFKKTSLSWDMNDKGNFNFTIDFYD